MTLWLVISLWRRCILHCVYDADIPALKHHFSRCTANVLLGICLLSPRWLFLRTQHDFFRSLSTSIYSPSFLYCERNPCLQRRIMWVYPWVSIWHHEWDDMASTFFPVGIIITNASIKYAKLVGSYTSDVVLGSLVLFSGLLLSMEPYISRSLESIPSDKLVRLLNLGHEPVPQNGICYVETGRLYC